MTLTPGAKMTRRDEMLALADLLEPLQYATGITFTYLEFRMVIDALRLSAQAEPGYVVVPKDALDWLFGEGPGPDGKWFGDTIGEHVPKLAGKYQRTYWWRSKFRTMIEAALPAPTTVAHWQPMETAPKDEDCLVTHDGFVSEAYYNGETDTWWLANTSEHDFDAARPIYPTHWMPLPTAPAKESAT